MSRDLCREGDHVWQANAGYTCAQVLADLQDTFLRADELATKKAEMEKKKQKGDILLYCMRFTEATDEAYAVVGRNVETERKLAEMFIVSLCDNEVIEELLKHDPHLVTLAAAQTAAHTIYDRTKHMSRVWTNSENRSSRKEECLEFCLLQNRLVEVEKALAAQTATATTGPARGGNYGREQHRVSGSIMNINEVINIHEVWWCHEY